MRTDSEYDYAHIRYSDNTMMETSSGWSRVPLLRPEWYSSNYDAIASHTFTIHGEEYHVDLMRCGTFKASWTPSRKDMPKEVDSINYNYTGHGDATRFLQACGVFNDEQLRQAYENNIEGKKGVHTGWNISMNPWFAVRISSHGVGWPDDFRILHEIPFHDEWHEILEEVYEYLVDDEFVRGFKKEE